MLALTLVGLSLTSERARRAYERETRAALADEYAAFAGPDADRLLDRLRSWQP